MKPAIALLALLATACGAGPESGRVDAAAPAGAEASYEFTVLATDPASVDPRILDWVDTDCGPAARVALARMPVDDPLLRPDRVVEYDEAGRERRRWHKSYSSEILALEGDDLYFGASEGGREGPFRTTPAGDVIPAVPLSTDFSATATLAECPDSLAAFANPEAVTCYRAVDGAGRTRHLAWEAGCP